MDSVNTRSHWGRMFTVAVTGFSAASVVSACSADTTEKEEPVVVTVTQSQTGAPQGQTASSQTADAKATQVNPENREPAPNGNNSGRSKADFPGYTVGRTGTGPAWEPNNTSPEFGSKVYYAFIDHWIATGNTQPTLNVTSPVTGQTYEMSCTGGQGTDSVLCQGGNNAKVYIYRPIPESVTKPTGYTYG
ncbi:hypothetical protein [Corynebacterium tapiri]|uniref:Uncharacterized protein n=1 Tax=Corynebacterium tapiri TaxID=1448266 RepID=A0A5C4U4Y6_9CORY|nr:hypothetical protein [Corynebacterium tapiri]TNL98385.1 hypothetical protein FHE74_04045 [Corynebacterium tapiri]